MIGETLFALEPFYHQFAQEERLYFRLYLSEDKKTLAIRSVSYAKAEKDFDTGLKTCYSPQALRIVLPKVKPENIVEGLGNFPKKEGNNMKKIIVLQNKNLEERALLIKQALENNYKIINAVYCGDGWVEYVLEKEQ